MPFWEVKDMSGRVAILGRGNVGKALQSALSGAGYEVRTTGKGPENPVEAVKWADIVILAVPYLQIENVIKGLDPVIKGKVLVDVTNSLNAQSDLAIGFTTSGAEELQKKVKDAKVVKSFNTVFAANMASGSLKGEKLTSLIASDHADAKKLVMEMAGKIGFDPVDAGPLRNARWIEALGFLNIQLGYALGMGSGIGFRLVH